MRLIVMILFFVTHFMANDVLQTLIKQDNIEPFQAYIVEQKINPIAVVKVVNKNQYDTSNHDYSALSLAIDANSYKIVKAILDSLSKEQLGSSYLQEMLLYACDRYAKDDTKMVELFLEKEIDVRYKDRYGYTPLLAQARYGTKKTLKKLLEKGANISDVWKGDFFFNDYDALSFALYGKNEETALFLLENYTFNLNKSFNHRYMTSYLPLLGSFYTKESPVRQKVLALVLERIDVRLIEKEGQKLFDAIFDKEEALKIAIKNSAFKAVFDANIYTKLFFTYKEVLTREDKHYRYFDKEKLPEYQKALLKYESYVANDDAKTRIEKIKATQKKLFRLIEAQRVFEAFAKGQNEALYMNELGGELLVVAAYKGDLKSMQKLLDGGIDVNYLVNLSKEDLRVLYPINPLLAASKGKQFGSVQFLLEKGARIDTADWYKQNALVYALDYATKEDMPLIELLLKRGVDANIEFDEYRLALSEIHFRPLNFALVFTEDLEVVKLLGTYAHHDLLTGQDYTHITRWLNEVQRGDIQFFSCERLSYALSLTKNKWHVPYHNDTLLHYLTKEYKAYQDIFQKAECSRNDALNLFFQTQQNYTQEQMDKIAFNEKERIKAYVYQRDLATNLLENKKLDALMELVEKSEDVTMLAKSKNISFLSLVVRQFSNDAIKDEKLLAIAKRLVQKGADVNQPASIFTPQTSFGYMLEYYAHKKPYEELIELMKKHGGKKL